MGLMDRDYMHEKHHWRPFGPPPERSTTSTLLMVLVFVAALFLLYKLADWQINKRAAELVGKQAPAPANQTVQRPTEPSAQPPPQASPLPTYHSTPESAAGTRVVTKCVVNGKTSYGDSSCAQGAITTQVNARADHNLMVAVRPSVVLPMIETVSQSTVVARNSPPSDIAAKNTECQLLNAEIENLDAMSRRPQGPQMLDWIRDQRKKARDRQFRIPCR